MLLFPHTSPPLTKHLSTAVPLTEYFSYQEKMVRTTKSKKRHWEETKQASALDFAIWQDVGIIRPGIENNYDEDAKGPNG